MNFIKIIYSFAIIMFIEYSLEEYHPFVQNSLIIVSNNSLYLFYKKK